MAPLGRWRRDPSPPAPGNDLHRPRRDFGDRADRPVARPLARRPPWLTRRIGHPVIWIGQVIGFWNAVSTARPTNWRAVASWAWSVSRWWRPRPRRRGGGGSARRAPGPDGAGRRLAAGVLLCQRSLAEHVTAVAEGLAGDVAQRTAGAVPFGGPRCARLGRSRGRHRRH